MILVDTSAWVEFFRRQGNATVKMRVAHYLQRDEAAFTCPVYFEILSGARPAEVALIEETFSLCQRVFFQPEHWRKAAEFEQQSRARGLTVPRDDIFVATVAAQAGLPIGCHDKHFDWLRDRAGLPLDVEQFGTKAGS